MCLGIKDIPGAEIVECPDTIVSGNMKVKIKEGSNPWWAAYQVLNTKNPINGMSMSTDGGATWVEMVGPEEPAPSGFWFMKPDGLILNADNGMENYKIRVESDTGDIVVDMVGVVDGSETDAGTNNAGGDDCSGSAPTTSPVPPPAPPGPRGCPPHTPVPPLAPPGPRGCPPHTPAPPLAPPGPRGCPTCGTPPGAYLYTALSPPAPLIVLVA